MSDAFWEGFNQGAAIDALMYKPNTATVYGDSSSTAALKMKCNRLSQERNSLIAKCNRLSQERNSLVADYNQLVKEYNEDKSIAKQLYAMNLKMKDRIDAQARELASLKNNS